MTTIDTKALREALAAGTPGPWELYDPNEGMWPPRPLYSIANNAFHNPPDDDDDWPAVNVIIDTGTEADAHLIVAAVNALPELLDRLEAAEAKVAAVEAVVTEFWVWEAGRPLMTAVSAALADTERGAR